MARKSVKKPSAAQLPGVSAFRMGDKQKDDDFVLFVWDADDDQPAPAAAAAASSSTTREVILSSAEREVLQLVEEGLSNADIAKARGTAVRTVANQVASLLKKLNLGSRFEIIARGRNGRKGRKPTTSRGA
jgi:DNA-binding NarL/FixJ family response regulator